MKVLGETGMDVLIEEIKKRTAGGDGNDGATNHLIPWEYLIKNEPARAFDLYQFVCDMSGLTQYLKKEDFTGPNKLDILNSDNPAGYAVSGGTKSISWVTGFAPITLEDLIAYTHYMQKKLVKLTDTLNTVGLSSIHQYLDKLCRYTASEGSSHELSLYWHRPINKFSDDELIRDKENFTSPRIDLRIDAEDTRLQSMADALNSGKFIEISAALTEDSSYKNYTLYKIGNNYYILEGSIKAIYMYNDFPYALNTVTDYNPNYNYSTDESLVFVSIPKMYKFILSRHSPATGDIATPDSVRGVINSMWFDFTYGD